MILLLLSSGNCVYAPAPPGVKRMAGVTDRRGTDITPQFWIEASVYLDKTLNIGSSAHNILLGHTQLSGQSLGPRRRVKVNSVSVSLTCFSRVYHSHGRLNNETPTLLKLIHNVTAVLVEALPAAFSMRTDKLILHVEKQRGVQNSKGSSMRYEDWGRSTGN